jgi:hypothetical protein
VLAVPMRTPASLVRYLNSSHCYYVLRRAYACPLTTTFATFHGCNDPPETCRWFIWATNGGYAAFHSRGCLSGHDNKADVAQAGGEAEKSHTAKRIVSGGKRWRF